MNRPNFKLYVVGLLIALLLYQPAFATGCRVVAVRQHVVHHKQAVVVEKVVNVVPVVAAYVPVIAATYAGVYAPPAAYALPGAHQQHQQQSQTDADLAAAVRSLAEEVRNLKARVDGQPGVGPTPGAPGNGGQGGGFDPFNPQALKAGASPHAQLLANRCIACHDASVAKTKGGGFTLFADGALAPLTGEQIGAALDEVSSGRMPRNTKVTDGERLEIVNALLRK